MMTYVRKIHAFQWLRIAVPRQYRKATRAGAHQLTQPISAAPRFARVALRSSGAVLRPACRTCGTCLRRPAVGSGTSEIGETLDDMLRPNRTASGSVAQRSDH